MEIDQCDQRQSYFQLIPLRIFNRIIDDLHDLRDLFNLARTCKKFHYRIRTHVRNVQICVLEYGGMHDYQHEPYENLILMQSFDIKTYNNYILMMNEFNPAKFVCPTNGEPYFNQIRKLYLDFSDWGPINLVQLTQLTHLKIRGSKTFLCPYVLPSVKNVDLDDVRCCDKGVFENVRTFKMEFDTRTLAEIYEMTDDVMIKDVFESLFDTLVNKRFIEDIHITLTLNFHILGLENFIDSLEQFLIDYNREMDQGRITVVLKHWLNYKNDIKNPESVVGYKPGLSLPARYKTAFDRLQKKLPQEHYNFRIVLIEEKNN